MQKPSQFAEPLTTGLVVTRNSTGLPIFWNFQIMFYLLIFFQIIGEATADPAAPVGPFALFPPIWGFITTPMVAHQIIT